jgi:RimJ/RimL family protein N-acetyltransferase
LKPDILTGELVRLTAEDPKILADAFSRWARDSEYNRLLDSHPTRLFSAKSNQKWMEDYQLGDLSNNFPFGIRLLSDDRLVGEIELDGINWTNRNCFVGIGIGDSTDWGKGYGTDAMKVILAFAFLELNLHRVSLNVFDYNPRAVASYVKAGFVIEGRERQYLNRAGRRWDVIYMGILRSEWEYNQKRK